MVDLHGITCPDCLLYLLKDGYAGYWQLRGACASVGIEHDKDTNTMMREFAAAYHDRGHQ